MIMPILEVEHICKSFHQTEVLKDITFSPIRGPEGNIEYLGYLQAGEGPAYEGDLRALVEQSHSACKEETP